MVENKQILIWLALLLVLPLISSTELFGYGHTPTTQGNITNIYNNNTNITNNYNAVVNDTQFSSNNPITIQESWLTSFVNSLTGGLYCQLTGCSMTGNIVMNYNNLTNVNYINKVAFRNVTTMGDVIVWDIELDG